MLYVSSILLVTYNIRLRFCSVESYTNLVGAQNCLSVHVKSLIKYSTLSSMARGKTGRLMMSIVLTSVSDSATKRTK